VTSPYLLPKPSKQTSKCAKSYHGRSASSWRRKAVHSRVTSEPWRALATISLSDQRPRSATQAQI
ncbi:hypothetical protein A2U01_0111293, partial [Trifolium medium]|nr:hypothetical protein [Trifolium medium]